MTVAPLYSLHCCTVLPTSTLTFTHLPTTLILTFPSTSVILITSSHPSGAMMEVLEVVVVEAGRGRGRLCRSGHEEEEEEVGPV